MTTKTINPFDALPEQPKKELASEPKVETARAHSLERTDICPDPACGRKMEKLNVGPIESPTLAWVCVAHRICLPIADD